jgi:hypothetical protein
MNFKYMPELNWIAGYPFGLAMIVLTLSRSLGSNGEVGSDPVKSFANIDFIAQPAPGSVGCRFLSRHL